MSRPYGGVFIDTAPHLIGIAVFEVPKSGHEQAIALVKVKDFCERVQQMRREDSVEAGM